MNNQQNSKKYTNLEKQKIGEVNHLLPKLTKDEIDLEIDVNRDAEITAEKPPHHS
jgi:uncharacterized membrane protein YjjP (DUF1212 family)